MYFMSDFIYLQPDQHYIDRYDLMTIRRTLDVVDTFQKAYQDMLKEPKIDESPSLLRDHVNQMLYDQLFYLLTDRYEHKKDVIEEWMSGDRKKQDTYDNTQPPEVHCVCGSKMNSTFKDLQSDSNDKNLKMLFFFDCPSCKKRRAVYDNGEEWIVKPRLCPECKKKVKEVITRKDGVLTTTTTCKSCGYTKKEVDDFEKKHKEWKAEREKEEQKDKALLEKYRNLFCFTEAQGQAALNEREAMQVALAIQKEEREKYNSEAYTEASKLKRLNIVDLEKLVVEPLTDAQYIKFSLDKPEDGPDFIVPFSVQDANSSRTSNISEYDLRKLLEGLLKDTNWRLMSGHISYRLGYLSGRIRGYEREEDLMELYKENQPKKKESKVTEAMKQKHVGSRWVRLAQMSGELEGIENARKRRLEKEPEGFFLEDSEGGGYTCNICHEQTPGSKVWWNLDGMRCSDCWRNIKEEVIPSLHRDNEDTWIREFQIQSDYGVHSATRRMLVRKGILIGRDLKRPDGDIYCTVYLIADNAEFLKQHPKKPESEPQINFHFPWVEQGITVEARLEK